MEISRSPRTQDPIHSKVGSLDSILTRIIIVTPYCWSETSIDVQPQNLNMIVWYSSFILPHTRLSACSQIHWLSTTVTNAPLSFSVSEFSLVLHHWHSNQFISYCNFRTVTLQGCVPINVLMRQYLCGTCHTDNFMDKTKENHGYILLIGIHYINFTIINAPK